MFFFNNNARHYVSPTLHLSNRTNLDSSAPSTACTLVHDSSGDIKPFHHSLFAFVPCSFKSVHSGNVSKQTVACFPPDVQTDPALFPVIVLSSVSFVDASLSARVPRTQLCRTEHNLQTSRLSAGQKSPSNPLFKCHRLV